MNYDVIYIPNSVIRVYCVIHFKDLINFAFNINTEYPVL